MPLFSTTEREGKGRVDTKRDEVEIRSMKAA